MFQVIIQTELLEEILIGSKLSKKNYFDRPDLACSEKQVLCAFNSACQATSLPRLRWHKCCIDFRAKIPPLVHNLATFYPQTQARVKYQNFTHAINMCLFRSTLRPKSVQFLVIHFKNFPMPIWRLHQVGGVQVHSTIQWHDVPPIWGTNLGKTSAT